MNPIFSRDNAHNQRLAEIEREISDVKFEYELEHAKKEQLFKQRSELSKKIDDEIERGENAKRLLKISE